MPASETTRREEECGSMVWYIDVSREILRQNVCMVIEEQMEAQA
jgi:hypothetical protein